MRTEVVWKAHKIAMDCVYHMWIDGFKPAAIFNLGVSFAFEIDIWKWQWPDVPVVAIDPGGKRRVVEHPKLNYIQACASDHTGTLQFCRGCRSTRCKHDHPADKFAEVPCVAINDFANQYAPPYFLWIDVDGGELAALHGATEVLKETGWINIEMSEWMPGDSATIDAFLKANGFEFFVGHHRSQDRIYKKVAANG